MLPRYKVHDDFDIYNNISHYVDDDTYKDVSIWPIRLSANNYCFDSVDNKEIIRNLVIKNVAKGKE